MNHTEQNIKTYHCPTCIQPLDVVDLKDDKEDGVTLYMECPTCPEILGIRIWIPFIEPSQNIRPVPIKDTDNRDLGNTRLMISDCLYVDVNFSDLVINAVENCVDEDENVLIICPELHTKPDLKSPRRMYVHVGCIRTDSTEDNK